MNRSTAKRAFVSFVGSAMSAVALAAANSASADQSTLSAPTHPCSLEGPSEGAPQLTYVPGFGWRYIAEAMPDSHESDAALQGMGSFFSAPTPQSLTDTSSMSNPSMVVIDGPTGYAFVWTHDSGWTFVGRIF
jgi:hypothetical protein